MAFIDGVVDVLIHIAQIPLELLGISVVLYAKGAYLLSLQGLDAFVLIPLNLLLRHYFLHLIDFIC